MVRSVFYSFHYDEDSWRASQVRNMGVVEGNVPARDNDWEEIRKNEDAIKRWIDDQMYGRSCAIVLIGSQTANRKWVNHEIAKAWNEGKGLLGIHIHNLKDQDGFTSTQGSNPFTYVSLTNGSNLAGQVRTHDPQYWDAYNDIRRNLASWIELAIQDAINQGRRRS